MSQATLLLPEPARFGGQRLREPAGKILGKADRLRHEGDVARSAFDILPRGWPVAAVTRQRDAGDAGADKATWLRADPAYVRPDINGARLLAWGEALQLSDEDASAFLPALRPLFGDAGFPIDAPCPSRWYLRLPPGKRLPVFSSPDDALGADLFEHMPGAENDDSPDARRWRTLLSEAQVTLHNHPRNAVRTAAGLAPVNSLWLWGAGALPDRVSTKFTRIASDDDALTAFASFAGAQAQALPDRWSGSWARALRFST